MQTNNLKGKLKTRKIVALTLFPLMCIVLSFFIFAKPNSKFIEVFYSKGLYVGLITVSNILTKAVPFSIGEILFLLGLLTLFTSIVFWGIRLGKRIKEKSDLKMFFKITGLNIVIVISAIIFLFYFIWGLNYLRIRLKHKLDYDGTKISERSLQNATESIAQKLNIAYQNLGGEKYDSKVINKAVNISLQRVLNKIDGINVPFSEKAKPLLLSFVMDKMLTTGICIPFTLEANYSESLTNAELPFVIAHEKAHTAGHTYEGDCNYIAYLACIHSDNPFAIYSGYFNVFWDFYSRYREINPEKAKTLVDALEQGIIDDVRKIYERVEKNRGIISEISHKAYDAYLKTNKIEEGAKSYGDVIDLIIATDFRLE